MKPKHWTAQLASELFNSRIIDENAETTAEIAAKSGSSLSVVQREAKRLVDCGKLEKVFKLVSGKPVPAYRVKK